MTGFQKLVQEDEDVFKKLKKKKTPDLAAV